MAAEGMNGSVVVQTLEVVRFPVGVQAVGMTAALFCSLVGIFGNVMLVTIVYKNPALHKSTPTWRFLASMSVAAIVLLCSLTLPHIIEYSTSRQEWMYSSIGCSFLTFLQHVAMNLTGAMVFLIAIDRYLATMDPIRSQAFTIKCANVLIMSSWTVISGYSAPWLVLPKVSLQNLDAVAVMEECDFDVSRVSYVAYHGVGVFTFFMLPVLTAIILNAITLVTFCRVPNRVTSGYAKQLCIISVSVSVFFILLWAPYRGLVLTDLFIAHKPISTWLSLVCRIAIYVSCVVNPILCLIVSGHVRRMFVVLIQCSNREHLNGTDNMEPVEMNNFHTRGEFQRI